MTLRQSRQRTDAAPPADDAEQKRAAFLDALEHRKRYPFPKDIDVEKLREEAMMEKYGPF